MRVERFRTGEPPRLSLTIPAGSIDVETAETGETVVELEPVRDDDREAVQEAVVAQRGREIVVEIHEERRFLFVGDIPEVRARIRCPHGAELAAKSVSADVHARGTLGATDVKTVSGDVDVERVDGEANVKTVSGDARLGEVSGRATTQTVSGDLAARRVSGSAEFRSVSGDAHVAEAGSSVTGQTVSGDVRIDAVSQGAVTLKTVSGDVRVGVREGSKLWVDAKSMSGDTSSDFALGDSPPGGEGAPTVEIRATAMSGDIRIMRAQ